MSAVIGEGGKGGSQDFELNLAPIIDALTVLITFLLASASFLSIGILEAGVTAAGEAPKSETPPAVNITVELKQDKVIHVKLDGKVNNTTPIKLKDGAWNYEELTQNLGSVKNKWPDVNAVTLSADNTVEYKDVVKAMETIRKTIPVVALGGF